MITEENKLVSDVIVRRLMTEHENNIPQARIIWGHVGESVDNAVEMFKLGLADRVRAVDAGEGFCVSFVYYELHLELCVLFCRSESGFVLDVLDISQSMSRPTSYKDQIAWYALLLDFIDEQR